MQHTDKEYEAELDQLRQRLLFMGAEVERNFGTAIDALRQMNSMLAQRVIEADEEIDALEVELDELSLTILARRQPVASDLRFITSTFRLVTDLERSADMAVNICERVKELASLAQPVPTSRNLIYMGELAQGQMHDALDAFVTNNVHKAESVKQRDAMVDSLYAQLFPELIAQMVGDPQRAEAATRQQSIGKCIERIADHATNIAETVIFMVQGRDVRHFHAEKSSTH